MDLDDLSSPLPLPRAAAARRTGGSTSAVLRSVLDHGPLSRRTIAQLTGLSSASVTNHTADLHRLGLLVPAAAQARPNRVGRPHVLLDIDTTRHVVCAVHIGVPNTTVGLLDVRGEVLAQGRVPHRSFGREQILGNAASALRELLREHAPGREPLGLGVATGGWVDRRTGTVTRHPILGWSDVAVTGPLEELTGLPARIDGHVRALVGAERLLGQVRSRYSILQLMIGNVVEAAFATRDGIHHGPGSQAGVVAHLPVPGSTRRCDCGRVGCLEATVSERVVVEQALAEGLVTDGSIGAVVDAALRGSAAAERILNDRARAVGRAAGLLLDIFNPEVLVVMEPGVNRLQSSLRLLRQEVGASTSLQRDTATAVVATSFPRSATAVAAGSVLLDALYADPVGVMGEGRGAGSGLQTASC